MIARASASLAVIGLVSLGAGTASAQTGTSASGRFEIAGGVQWIGGLDLGSRDATLTTSTGDRYTPFSTSSEIDKAVGANVRVGFRLTRVIQLEAAASYVTPMLRTSISGDQENGAPTIASESFRQFAVEGGAAIWLPCCERSLVRPFASIGGGYVRELDEGGSLVETGRLFYAGGGVSVPFVTRAEGGRLKQAGVRIDARAVVRSGGVTPGRHVVPSIGASLFARF